MAGERPNAEQARDLIGRLEKNVGRVIVGKPRAIRMAVVALLARGHLLVEDVPGVGKTMLARSLARSVDLRFRRVQFTPDLLPADITGTTFFNQQEGTFQFRQGPVFTEVLLADEINRATPRTQAALLECMEEQQVTAEGITRPLGKVFFVVATQNPIELAGTFPLPEAQLDRFLVAMPIGYPSLENEIRVLEGQVERHPLEKIEPVLEREELLALQDDARRVYVDPHLKRYIVSIVSETREHREVLLGASTRGSLAVMRTAQAWALADGKPFVSPHHVKDVAQSVLGHRLILRPEARLSGLTANRVLTEVLDSVPVPVHA